MPSLSASPSPLPFSKPSPASSAMEPSVSAPPSSGATTTTTTAPLFAPLYPGSVDSSPRSRSTETWEGGAGDALPPVPGGGKLRLMCSYGGHIVPRPHDKSLCYVGGETRIVVVDRNSTLPEILQRLSKILINGRPFILKYQLPNEDLDSLITVSSEEDLENMIDEYDRLTAGANPAKSSRIRLFLFPTKLEVAASMGPILDGSNKSNDWFLNVLNGADLLQRGFSDPSSVNCLLGLEENGRSSRNLDLISNEGEGQVAVGEGMGGGKGRVGNLSNQDVHSMLDSSVIETNSSFGSASSSPAMANLPRIRVHVEEGVGGGGARVFDQRIGIEDQFAAHMGVNVQRQEEGFVMMSSQPSNLPVAGVPFGGAGEYTNRIVSDDDRSDHGAPVGYLNQPPPPPLVMVPTSQAQNKQITEDLPSPGSVSSDCSSLSNATTTRQKQVMYQDPSGQITSGSNRVPAMVYTEMAGQVQVQQVPDSGYVMPSHYDQLQQQSIQSQHQQQQPHQFIHASSNQYVHHHPAGGMPLMYYPVYPPQQSNPQHQINQQYPVYYVPAGQTHAYNMPVQQQQPSYTEAPSSQPQASNPTYSTSRNMPPEIPQAGVYRTGNAASPQLVQVPSHQHQPQQHQQFMGYSQIHHPSQSMTPASAAAYAYELSDPAHAQVYFTQPMAPQYQTMNSGPTMAGSDASAAIPNDNVKPQARTSQAL